MSLAFRLRLPFHGPQALPPEIYLPLVDSLFKEGRTLLIGTVFITGSIFITYWKTGEILLLYCALAVLLVGCARGIVIRAYLRARRTVRSTEIARRWEFRYGVGASATVALLGIWCFIAFAWTTIPLPISSASQWRTLMRPASSGETSQYPVS